VWFTPLLRFVLVVLFAVAPPPAPAATPTVPTPAHTLVVIMENHSYSEIMGSTADPYIHQLAASGALFTNSYAVTHPSEPNYLALFSGSTQGVTDDSCPHTFSAANLGAELIAAHYRFGGYSESLPGAGWTGCSYGSYARKHNPWVNFPSVPSSANQPFTALPHLYSALPTVALVVPNLMHDMHDGTIAQGDQWLKTYLSGVRPPVFRSISLESLMTSERAGVRF
jgi:acid phosphatase